MNTFIYRASTVMLAFWIPMMDCAGERARRMRRGLPPTKLSIPSSLPNGRPRDQEPVHISSSPMPLSNPYHQHYNNPYTQMGAHGEVDADDECGCLGMVDLEEESRADSDENMCSYCLDEVQEDQPMVKLACHHMVHKDCLNKMIQRGYKECAWCRVPLSDVDQLGNNQQSSGDEHCRAADRRIEMKDGVAVDIGRSAIDFSPPPLSVQRASTSQAPRPISSPPDLSPSLDRPLLDEGKLLVSPFALSANK